MATDTDADSRPDSPIATPDLLSFVQDELDADAKRQAQLQAAGGDDNDGGEMPQVSPAGATLDLSHKRIHDLPVEVVALIRDQVERLAISHNKVILCSEIVQCDRLRYLNIRWNYLKHFPGEILQLSKLEILDISKNELSEIPEDIKKMTSLKFLAAARNRITKLPITLCEMISLSKLKIDDNPIEYPPADVLKTEKELAGLEPVSRSKDDKSNTEREKEICQKVKRFMKAQQLRERLKPSSEEESTEANLETPRPPRRHGTNQRFPVRPSISGAESMTGTKFESPSDLNAPPIPQRSHARLESGSLPITKRPTMAPIRTDETDMSRSRSETGSSSASLRQRRQGFITRKGTNDLSFVSEVSGRSSQATTLVDSGHSRATSSVSTVNGFLAPSGGETSSGGGFSGDDNRYEGLRSPASLPDNRTARAGSNATLRGLKRLMFSLFQLERPLIDIAHAIKDGTPQRSPLDRHFFTARTQINEIDRLVTRLENGFSDGTRGEQGAMKAIVRTSLQALKAYSAVVVELKRCIPRILRMSDGIYIRSLMFQIYASMIEARNICTLLGFRIKDRPPQHLKQQPHPHASQAWSSKTSTPTQPKPPETNRRTRVPTMPGMNSKLNSIRAPPPPRVPPVPHISRANTISSLSSATPRSSESFATMAATNPHPLPSIRTVEESESEQFERIFLKLQSACNLAGQALPHCRAEFQARREAAQNTGQSRLAQSWSSALGKCDEVIANNKALKKKLESVRVNDPGMARQREFWAGCDAFVHSWTDLATLIKDLSAGPQRVDTTTIRQVMRNVQRNVKDVSKTISHSTLYHTGLGISAPAQPPSNNSPYVQLPQQPSNGYITPVPATPLSAALGPAAQATLTAAVDRVEREREREPPQTARAVRNDTPMQPILRRQ